MNTASCLSIWVSENFPDLYFTNFADCWNPDSFYYCLISDIPLPQDNVAPRTDAQRTSIIVEIDRHKADPEIHEIFVTDGYGHTSWRYEAHIADPSYFENLRLAVRRGLNERKIRS